MGVFVLDVAQAGGPSMKVPPKRKGNSQPSVSKSSMSTLNESPSEKEGKYRAT